MGREFVQKHQSCCESRSKLLVMFARTLLRYKGIIVQNRPVCRTLIDVGHACWTLRDVRNSTLISPLAAVIKPKDYPALFRGKFAHPDDYKIDSKPVSPEIFLYKSGEGHNRLFVRASVRTSKDGVFPESFTAATFLVDTGFPSDLLVCNALAWLMRHRVNKDANHDYIKVKIGDEEHSCDIKIGAEEHQQVNVMGLPWLFALGLQFKPAMFRSLVPDDNGIVQDVVVSAKKFSHF